MHAHLSSCSAGRLQHSAGTLPDPLRRSSRWVRRVAGANAAAALAGSRVTFVKRLLKSLPGTAHFSRCRWRWSSTRARSLGSTAGAAASCHSTSAPLPVMCSASRLVKRCSAASSGPAQGQASYSSRSPAGSSSTTFSARVGYRRGQREGSRHRGLWWGWLVTHTLVEHWYQQPAPTSASSSPSRRTRQTSGGSFVPASPRAAPAAVQRLGQR